ncbi:hypothetical protein MN608_10883 [Microdochium nivale]|nr:hypothetical protein MN608_10883 [Microdochium nivale]
MIPPADTEMEANRRLGLAAMWFATGLAIVLSIARLYVRLFMIKAYGLDDHAYMIALLPLIAGTSILTFSTTYNWGTPASDPAISSPPSIVVDTRPQPFPGMVSPQLLGVIGQGLLVLGSALAKSAVGMFQLRFVTVPWQRASIYAWMGAALGLAVAVNVSQYTVCTPAAYFWDTTISEGTCAFDFLTLFMVLSVTWVVVDLYYAVLPWLFVRQLNMPYKEKVIVLSSMSLGLLASGFGIARVVGLTHLTPNGDSNSDLLPAILDTCEYAITMICVCIPVCNPLWISWARRIFWSSSRRNRDARRQHNGRKTRAWWRRGQWRQRQQRQSLHEEAIYDGTSAGEESG